MKKLSLIILLLLSILAIPLTADAVDPFTVRVIYFQPADVKYRKWTYSHIYN